MRLILRAWSRLRFFWRRKRIKEVREWLVALGTMAATAIAALALIEAIVANEHTLRVLNDDMTPWLAFGNIEIGADSGSTGLNSLHYGVQLEVENYGRGPSLGVDYWVANSQGHSGSSPGLALMPGEKANVGVVFTQRARDLQQLHEWHDRALSASGEWLSVRVTYRRLDGRVFEMTDTDFVVGNGQCVWRGTSIRRVTR